MYRFFASDIWVDDFHACFKPLEQGLGLPTVPAEKKAMIPGFGVWYTFAPVGDDSTTFFEILALNPDDVPATKADRVNNYPFIPEVMAAQGTRPMKTHATEIVVRSYDHFDTILERLASKGLRHRLDEPDEQLAMRRVWPGWEAGDEARYLPETDGGLRLEVLSYELASQSTDVIQTNVAGDTDRPDADSGVSERIDDPIHFESREFLVSDIDVTVTALEENFDWTPKREWTTNGTRHVEMGFEDPKSATLQIVKGDRADSEAGAALEQWGPGPYTMRFAVPDLDRRKEALESVGIAVKERDATDGSGRPSLFVAHDAGLGTNVEFVEAGD